MHLAFWVVLVALALSLYYVRVLHRRLCSEIELNTELLKLACDMRKALDDAT